MTMRRRYCRNALLSIKAGFIRDACRYLRLAWASRG
jgi:hypothetical protein